MTGEPIPLGPGEDDTMPTWCEDYLSAAQVERMLPRTRWAVLLDAAPLSASAHHVALRLHLYAVGSDDASAYPSVARLMAATGLSRNPVRAALRELADAGWVIPYSRVYPSGKRASTRYELAWPEDAADVMVTPGVRRCLAERPSGPPCRRAAGWGTDHPGTGRCSDHDHPVGGQEKTRRGSREDPPRGSGEDPVGGQEKTPSVELWVQGVKNHRALTPASEPVDDTDHGRDHGGSERDDKELRYGREADQLIKQWNAVPPEKRRTAWEGWRQARFANGWTIDDIEKAERIAAQRSEEQDRVA